MVLSCAKHPFCVILIAQNDPKIHGIFYINHDLFVFTKERNYAYCTVYRNLSAIYQWRGNPRQAPAGGSGKAGTYCSGSHFRPAMPMHHYIEDGVLHCPAVKLKKIYGYGLASPYSHTRTKLLEEFHPDIIHIHTEFSMGISGIHIAHKLKVPLVYTLHTMYDDYVYYVAPKHLPSWPGRCPASMPDIWPTVPRPSPARRKRAASTSGKPASPSR